MTTTLTSGMLEDALAGPARVREMLSKDADTVARLGQRMRHLRPAVLATVARGSSDNAALYATYLVPQITGRLVLSVPPSVVTVLDAQVKLEGQVLVALSQGGGGPDVVRTVERCKEGGAYTVAIVNDVASPLAQAVDVVLPQHAGSECLAATKSVLCSMTAIARLAAEWGEDPSLRAALDGLPNTLEEAAHRGTLLDPTWLKDVSHVYVVGRSLGYSVASELALKLKETCGVQAEAMSAAEVQHGPQEIVDERFLVIALELPGPGSESVSEVARLLGKQGARVLTVGPSLSATHDAGPQVPLPVEDARLSPIVALQYLYPWVARTSKALGRDPDHPLTLKSKIIKTW